jgi:hypothetical protein
MLYYAFIAVISWMLVGAFYLAFAVALKRNLDETSDTRDKLTKWSTPLIFLYGLLLVGLVIVSFAVKPRKIEAFYRTISLILGIYSYSIIFLTIFFIFRSGFNLSDTSQWAAQMSAVLVLMSIIMFVVIILLHWKSAVIPVAKGAFFFVFMIGTYVNVLMIYAICNIHDCSWGNRPDKMTIEEKKVENEYRNDRTRWVLVWVFCNGAFAYFLNLISSSGGTASQGFINILALTAYFIVGIRFIGGVLYVLDEWMCCCFHQRQLPKEDKILISLNDQ